MREEDLDAYITRLIDNDSKRMLEFNRGGVSNDGRETEQVKKLGTVAECVSACGVPCEDVLQN